jgi:hypothetical protein
VLGVAITGAGVWNWQYCWRVMTGLFGFGFIFIVTGVRGLSQPLSDWLTQ